MLRPQSPLQARAPEEPSTVSRRRTLFDSSTAAIRPILISLQHLVFTKSENGFGAEIRRQVVSEQAQPLLPGLDKRALHALADISIFEPEYILEMMNHFMDQDRQLGRSAASPVVGRIYCLSSVVVDGDSVVLSKPCPVIVYRLLDGKQGVDAQDGNFNGRHDSYAVGGRWWQGQIELKARF